MNDEIDFLTRLRAALVDAVSARSTTGESWPSGRRGLRTRPHALALWSVIGLVIVGFTAGLALAGGEPTGLIIDPLEQIQVLEPYREETAAELSALGGTESTEDQARANALQERLDAVDERIASACANVLEPPPICDEIDQDSQQPTLEEVKQEIDEVIVEMKMNFGGLWENGLTPEERAYRDGLINRLWELRVQQALLGDAVDSSDSPSLAVQTTKLPAVTCKPGVFISEENVFGGAGFAHPDDAAKAFTTTALPNIGEPDAETSNANDSVVEYEYKNEIGDTVARVVVSRIPDGGWVVELVVACADELASSGAG